MRGESLEHIAHLKWNVRTGYVPKRMGRDHIDMV